MALPADRPMIASVSMGRQRVVFRYTLDKHGRVVVGCLRFYAGAGSGQPSCVVRYSYD